MCVRRWRMHMGIPFSHPLKLTHRPNIGALFQITFFMGTLVNEICNKCLKHWIQEPRPIDRLHISEEYGMPSSHSQFIWFFSTYVTLFVYLRWAVAGRIGPLKSTITPHKSDTTCNCIFICQASPYEQQYTAIRTSWTFISFTVLLVSCDTSLPK